MSKKKVDQRVKKMAVNSEWTRNVLKSMGFAATDIVKDLMPNTAEFAKSSVNAVDMIKDIRGNMSSRLTFGKQFANIPQIKQTEKALKTIVNDIKTGNLYGSSDFDDMDFGFGDEFGDDDGLEFIEDDSPSSQPQQTVLNTLPVDYVIPEREKNLQTITINGKDLTLDISKYMYDRFKELGVPVSLTRSGDTTLSPSERTKKAQSFYGDGKDVLVISNHLNAGGRYKVNMISL